MAGDGVPQLGSDGFSCQACGACCAFSRDWPRFTVEDDRELEDIPRDLVNAASSGMRCDGDRCRALTGEVGIATACSIYAVRPAVCRDCAPGDDACLMARRSHGL